MKITRSQLKKLIIQELNQIKKGSRVVSQDELKGLLKKNTKRTSYLKVALAAIIPTESLTDEELKNNGLVDGTEYSDEYKKENPQVLVQFKKDGTLDMYNVSSMAVKTYVDIKPTSEFLNQLKKIGLDGKKGTRIAVKNVPVQMIAAADLGIKEGDSVEQSWGGNQKIVGQYFIVDEGSKGGYAIGGENGLPIGYVKL